METTGGILMSTTSTADGTFFDAITVSASGVVVVSGVVTGLAWLANESLYALALTTLKNLLCPTLLLASVVISSILTAGYILWRRTQAGEYALFTVIFLGLQIATVVWCTESTTFRDIAVWGSAAMMTAWVVISFAIWLLEPRYRR